MRRLTAPRGPTWARTRHVGQRGRARANQAPSPIGERDNSRNSAACTQSRGADVQECNARVWVSPVGPSCVHEARSVGRVPRATQHAGVGGVERRAIIDERQDVVKGEVTRWMRRMLGTIARADVAVLADMAGDHPPGQASPSCIRMDVMVGTDARQARMLAAASSRSARDDATDRAELHPRIVGGLAGAVYSPAVLRLRGHARAAQTLDRSSNDAARAQGTFDPYPRRPLPWYTLLGAQRRPQAPSDRNAERLKAECWSSSGGSVDSRCWA
jgi:hypothetical protein